MAVTPAPTKRRFFFHTSRAKLPNWTTAPPSAPSSHHAAAPREPSHAAPLPAPAAQSRKRKAQAATDAVGAVKARGRPFWVAANRAAPPSEAEAAGEALAASEAEPRGRGPVQRSTRAAAAKRPKAKSAHLIWKTRKPMTRGSASKANSKAAESVAAKPQPIKPAADDTDEVMMAARAAVQAGERELNPAVRKRFLPAGMFCPRPSASADETLVSRVLAGHKQRAMEVQSEIDPTLLAADAEASSETTDRLQGHVFPPLPLADGPSKFFHTETDFDLPFNILWENERRLLNGKRRPPAYRKLRANAFPERPKRAADVAVCECEPADACGTRCLNRMMSFLCGKSCPAGARCTNKSLAKRVPKATKVAWSGARGFGLYAAEDISAGEFVIDYRGEVLHKDTYVERLNNQYRGKTSFYALAYDRDEVLDSGMRGNDARYINHSCSPNMEVRRYQALGDGYDEFEIGVWAAADIQAGDEASALTYHYNFEPFTLRKVNRVDMRTACQCGAPTCIGYLGRRPGEKRPKDYAAGLDLAEQRRQRVLAAKREASHRRREAQRALKRAMARSQQTAAAAGSAHADAARAAELHDMRQAILVKARAAKIAKANARRLADGLPTLESEAIAKARAVHVPKTALDDAEQARRHAAKVAALAKAREAKRAKREQRLAGEEDELAAKPCVIARRNGKVDFKAAAQSSDPERAAHAQEMLRIKAVTLEKARAVKRAKEQAQKTAAADAAARAAADDLARIARLPAGRSQHE